MTRDVSRHPNESGQIDGLDEETRRFLDFLIELTMSNQLARKKNTEAPINGQPRENVGPRR